MVGSPNMGDLIYAHRQLTMAHRKNVQVTGSTMLYIGKIMDGINVNNCKYTIHYLVSILQSATMHLVNYVRARDNPNLKNEYRQALLDLCANDKCHNAILDLLDSMKIALP